MPLSRNECWTIGFVSVQLLIAGDYGFNTVEDYLREMIGQLAAKSITGN